METQEIEDAALSLLDRGLLPADKSNVYIFVKIVSVIMVLVILSGVVGFFLGYTLR